MLRIVGVCLVLAIAVTGWIGFDQHRRAQVRQADADAANASANEALEAARARLKSAPASTIAPMPAPTSPLLAPPVLAPASAPASAAFACDGRTHCSQMHSCAEAQYFLAHCPNVKMDGNHDGEPCEQQFPECGR